MKPRDRYYRFPTKPHAEAIRGIVFKDKKKNGRIFLLSTDMKTVITEIFEVGSYTTPRHTPGVRMHSYRAIYGGVHWMGRASGRILTLRRVPSERD